jgi:L-ascorbate metabolism protein UlaG (beta-lactamase superfamily)
MERPMRFALIAFLLFAPLTAFAQGAAPAKPEMNESCPGLVAQQRTPFIPAALRLAALKEGEVRINYVGHSTFLIESPKLVRIATDYNDYVRMPVVPDIVTMNHAHSTHFTDHPDPAIKHVLRGWGPSPDQPARHDIQVGDVRVRNVPTNIRNYMTGGTERHGNSIFIFEIANLCIAHLGHLHHTLTQQQLNEIGRLDAVMVPVDGGVTLDLEGMSEVLAALKAPLMIPMHYFSTYTLRRFLDVLGGKSYEVEMSETPSVVLSKTTLPAKPKVLVLPGRAF